MMDLFRLFLSKSWEFFQIPWPGFRFTIGQVFLAVMVSLGALTMIAKMTGVSVLGSARGFLPNGGNNRTIKVSKERKGDTK